MRFISTRVHGVLDYATAAALIVVPRSLPLENDIDRLLAGAGLVTVAYSALTRYELGLARVLPMKLHLLIDMASGAFFAASPLLLDVEDGRTKRMLLGIGMFELVVPLLSKTKRSR